MLGRVRLYVCRHAHAGPGDPDDLRELTSRGRAEARELATRLGGERRPPALVLTSPLLRARQTAAVVADALRAELRVEPRLAPGATASDVTAVLAATAVDTVATIGHQPDCSGIAFSFAGRDPGFPTGGMLALDLES